MSDNIIIFPPSVHSCLPPQFIIDQGYQDILALLLKAGEVHQVSLENCSYSEEYYSKELNKQDQFRSDYPVLEKLQYALSRAFYRLSLLCGGIQ